MNYKYFIAFTLIAFMGYSCSQQKENTNVQTQTEDEQKFAFDDDKLFSMATSYFEPLPNPEPFDNPKAKLGKKLYYETALSVNGKLSCNSCHLLDKYGVDNKQFSEGHDGSLGDRNSPTVYNASWHIAQFWDGRAADLTEQAKGPILNQVEMGIKTEAEAEKNIAKIPEYKQLFADAFPNDKGKITYQSIADAIASFEKTLTTPSRVDNYLKGDKTALTDLEKEGLHNFINSGCITCHVGPGFGGTMYHKFGLINGPYWDYTGSTNQDEGRAKVTGNESDKYFFKVPSLRNVAETAPYFHEGSVKELNKAVTLMAKMQLNKDLTEQEVKSIVAFLEALTGEIPKHALLQTDEVASL